MVTSRCVHATSSRSNNSMRGHPDHRPKHMRCIQPQLPWDTLRATERALEHPTRQSIDCASPQETVAKRWRLQNRALVGTRREPRAQVCHLCAADQTEREC